MTVMNWLAHALLSPPETEVRLGNLLADLVKGPDRRIMSEPFRRGLQIHLAIDRFTDAHPLVHRSIARLEGAFRLAGGIVIDILYDHLLAQDWSRYCTHSLEDFATTVWADLEAYLPLLPPDTAERVHLLMDHNLFVSYRQVEGIESALRNVSRRIRERTGHELHLEKAIEYLIAQRRGLTEDFTVFFSELSAHVTASK